MESEEEGFLTALDKDHKDWDTRLIYADWLIDHDRPEEAERQRAYRGAWEWMEEQASQHYTHEDYYSDEYIPFTAEDLVQAPIRWEEHRDFLTQINSESLRNWFWNNSEEFWRNWEIIKGRSRPARDEWGDNCTPFSCSC